ncbi:MAG: F0F1 ATP synthase subunit delta [Treponema sp.]|nr:F0F1 ATP synthase subunit delta [Treponema sp.]
MFRPEPWAEAFVKAAGTPLGAKDALEYLKVFCRAALALPGDLSGKNDADRLGKIIKAALARTGFAAESCAENQGGSAGEVLKDTIELAERFVQLMLRKKCFHRYKGIIREIEKIIHKKMGIEEVFVEAAVDLGEDLVTVLKEKAKQLSGAKDIIFSIRLIPDLIGGFRIRWGSMLFDGSIKGQLQKMTADLGALYSG